MKICPKCHRKLVRVFHGDPDDEMAIESMDSEIIITNCCDSSNNYYCEYCDEFHSL